MQMPVYQSPQAARAAIRYRLPELVYQYLIDVGADREWISCTDILKHFALGKRENMMSQALLKLHATGRQRLSQPERISEEPVFVLQVRERRNSVTSKTVRVFLVERNHFYKQSLA